MVFYIPIHSFMSLFWIWHYCKILPLRSVPFCPGWSMLGKRRKRLKLWKNDFDITMMNMWIGQGLAKYWLPSISISYFLLYKIYKWSRRSWGLAEGWPNTLWTQYLISEGLSPTREKHLLTNAIQQSQVFRYFFFCLKYRDKSSASAPYCCPLNLGFLNVKQPSVNHFSYFALKNWSKLCFLPCPRCAILVFELKLINSCIRQANPKI